MARVSLIHVIPPELVDAAQRDAASRAFAYAATELGPESVPRPERLVWYAARAVPGSRPLPSLNLTPHPDGTDLAGSTNRFGEIHLRTDRPDGTLLPPAWIGHHAAHEAVHLFRIQSRAERQPDEEAAAEAFAVRYSDQDPVNLEARRVYFESHPPDA